MKNKILIIANGPSILNENFGSAIDNFNEVARINNYQIDGFHKHIGSKTTIWFNGGNQNLKKPVFYPKKVIVFIPYEILHRKEKKVKKKLPFRLGMNSNDYEVVKKEKMKSFEINSNIKRPTTGLNSILWAIENYNKVFIHGFDFFQESKAHYYDSNIFKKIIRMKILIKGEKHNNIAEKRFVNQLISDKKIFLLNEYINNKIS